MIPYRAEEFGIYFSVFQCVLVADQVPVPTCMVGLTNQASTRVVFGQGSGQVRDPSLD